MKKKRETKAKLKKRVGEVTRALKQLENDIEYAGTDRAAAWADNARYIRAMEADAESARQRLNDASETFRRLGKALNVRMMPNGGKLEDAGMTDGEMRDLFLRAAGQVAHAAYELDSDNERMRKLRWFFVARSGSRAEPESEFIAEPTP